MLRLIIWLSLAWLPLLIYFIHRSEARFKKNIAVEVTLPYRAQTDSEVQCLLDRFVRQIRRVNIVLFLLTIPIGFLERTTWLITAWMTWLFFAVTVPMIPYVRTNMSLKRLKIERGWKKANDLAQTDDSGKDRYMDDDDYWIGGVVYYNPNDRRLLVNSRVGFNSTVNLAKTSGKIIAGILILLLLSLPFVGVMMNSFEKQPLSLELTEHLLVAHRGSHREELELSEISDIQQLTELPEHMKKRSGATMDYLLSGIFSIQGVGNAKVSLDPTVPPFLLVSMRGGSLFLFGTRQPGEVEAIFKQLK